MKFRVCSSAIVLAVLALLATGGFAASENAPGVSIADLMNPDDVMLRKPAQASAEDATELARKAAAEKAAAEAAAKAAADARRRAEEQARKEAEQRERLRKEAEAKAAAEAAAKAAAEAKRREEERARKEAEEKAAAEAAAKAAEEARQRAEEEARQAAKTKKLAPPAGPQPDILETTDAKQKSDTGAKRKDKKRQPGRDAVITAERTDYDRKEGVILFDRNVYVDDEQYQLHADRLFLFLDGTNDLKRLVALGNVAITNEEKNASCARAVYVKQSSKIVMYGEDGNPAQLYQGGKKGSTVKGERITFWLNSEQVEIEKPVVTVPGGSFGGGDGKDLFKNMKK